MMIQKALKLSAKTKAVIRGKFIVTQLYLRKQEISQTNLTPKATGERTTNKTQRKEIK